MGQEKAASQGDFMVDCCVHGPMRFPYFIKQIVDTPEFQRLRYLRQLGVSEYVFPGAQHNRFCHCLGTAHLSGLWVQHFIDIQPELNLTRRHKELAMVAGLCHDLGHGPFSHVFDRIFLPLVGVEWEHEEGSVNMLHLLLKNNDLAHLFEAAELATIAEMIHNKPTTKDRLDAFLYEMIDNSRNFIDVDKFDYLCRDSHHTGFNKSVDFKNIIECSRVVGNQICYEDTDSVAWRICEVFNSRQSNFRTVYFNQTTKAVEYMVADILKCADPILKISESVWTERFTHMTDDLLRFIESSDALLFKNLPSVFAGLCPGLPALPNMEPHFRALSERMRPARELIHRIRTRNFYPFVSEAIIPRTSQLRTAKPDTILYGILSHAIAPSDSKSLLEADDLRVCLLSYDFGGKSVHPVSRTRFFRQGSNPRSLRDTYLKDLDKITTLLPKTYEEKTIRVYVCSKDKVEVARRAFTNFCCYHGFSTNDLFLETEPHSMEKDNRLLELSSSQQTCFADIEPALPGEADDKLIDSDNGAHGCSDTEDFVVGLGVGRSFLGKRKLDGGGEHQHGAGKRVGSILAPLVIDWEDDNVPCSQVG